MISDWQFKVANAAHRVALGLSFGRLGRNLLGMPALELTTVGRRSGEPRKVMLTSPYRDGDKIALVASAGGNDEDPAWLRNLRANPDVEVRYPGQDPREMRARITEGDERARLWAQITEDHENYAGYQQKTDREIPIVLLEPRT
jgi:deazaflavin-dependent oxidoreductase (nitroreductase family)